MPLKASDYVICPGCNDPVRESRLIVEDDALFSDGDNAAECPLCGHKADRAEFKPAKA